MYLMGGCGCVPDGWVWLCTCRVGVAVLMFPLFYRNKLAVDYLMEDLHGNSEEGVYPPPALSSFLNIFMSPNLLHQHCLVSNQISYR